MRKLPLISWDTMNEETREVYKSTPDHEMRTPPFIINQDTYRRSGNFRVKKLSYDKYSCKKNFVGTTPYRISVSSAC